MIDWIINNAFGTWGRSVMDFYLSNSLPINIPVIGYGVFLIYLHLRLRPFRRAAIDQTMNIISAAGKPGSGPKLYTYVARKLDWSAVVAVGEGALITGRWGLWPVRATAERLQKVLPVSELCRDAIAEREKKAAPRLGRFEE